MTWPLPPDATATYFVALALAMLITGIGKAGFGGGIGILAVPLTAAVLPDTKVALGTLLPLLIIADLFANLHHVRNRDPFHLRWLCIGALGGVVGGTALLLFVLAGSADSGATLNSILKFVVGGVCLVLVLIQMYRLFGGHVPHIPGRPGPASTVGFVAGFVSTLAHAAGPIVSIYLLEQRLEKRLLVGTAAAYFLLINLAKMPTFVGIGFTTWDTFWQSLWVVPFIPIGTLLGYWMHKHIPERPFAVTLYIAAVVAAADLIAQAIGWYSLRDLAHLL
ncbi:MAG: sulfite exporter TauE/SafE family protein [Phycisphaeraceae bacterium]